jgi:hypothetical protein
MRVFLCGLLLIVVGCKFVTPPEEPPTPEDGNGSDVVRINFIDLWEPGAKIDPERVERDRTEKPTDAGVERGPAWRVKRRVVLMTTAPADPMKALQEYADRLGAEVTKVPGTTTEPGEKGHTSPIGPVVTVRYSTAGRVGTIQATVTTLDGTKAPADVVLAFLHYQSKKEAAIGRGHLQEKKGPALVVYVEESKK